jgi:hypothetical protein
MGAMVLSLSLLASHTSVADPQPGPPARIQPNAKPATVIGGWLATTEIDGKQRGHWLELAADRSWRRIEDHFGFRAENHGHWRPDGDGAVLEDVGVNLHLADGTLLLVYRGQTLYAFQPCPTMPKYLGELPPFPRTLSETVAILAAELSEQDRIVMAGTLETDLVRFHHGLGTYIRNRFGLWGANPALLAACKVSHPEDASAVVLRALRDHLRKTRPGGRELEHVEGLLRELTLPPLPVRQTTVVRLVSVLNLETRRALRRKGVLEDALVFELARPSDDAQRRKRDVYWLNHPPDLRAWGQGDKRPDDISPMHLLAGFRTWLQAPNRVVLEPTFDPRWYQTPEKSPDFASVRWRDDWFELETSIEEGEQGRVRIDAWSMLGASPPMSVEQAVAHAGAARDRIPAGKMPLEIALTAAPAQSEGAPGAWQWLYAVRSAFTDQAAGGQPPADLSPQSLRRSQWPDLRQPPRLSAALALTRFRNALTPSPNPLARVRIRLVRLSTSARWYYQVTLGEGDETVAGHVTLDGRVFPSKSDGDSARSEQAVR